MSNNIVFESEFYRVTYNGTANKQYNITWKEEEDNFIPMSSFEEYVFLQMLELYNLCGVGEDYIDIYLRCLFTYDD